MPRFHGKISYFEFSRGEFTEALKNTIVVQMRQAARLFVKTILVSVAGSFPVDSGMAKGSFLNLSRVLGKIPIEITPRSTKKKYYGFNARGRIKSPGLGSILSTQYGSIEDVIQQTGNEFKFIFETNVFHYLLNEFYGITKVPNTPWKTFEAGRMAFINYLRSTGFNKMPRISDFLIRTTISFGKGGRGLDKSIERIRLNKNVRVSGE